MEEKIQLIEIENSLNRLKQLSERMSKVLSDCSIIIQENINSGVGVWDSEMAGFYRTRWENLMQEFPEILNIIKQQESNLDQYIKNMKKVEDR